MSMVPMNTIETSRSFSPLQANPRGLWHLFVVLIGLAWAPCAARAEAPPIVQSFLPTSGPTGTEVTINGANFGGITAVSFGGVAAEFRSGVSDTTLLATVPSGAVTGPIQVVTQAGSSTSAAVFTVTAALAPVISSFSPESGPVGTRVTINGSNFTDVSDVRFDGRSAEFVALGDSISATVPEGASSGPITVVTAGGSAVAGVPFTVTVAAGPRITSFTPVEGRPGTAVTILGENLASATSVSFNGALAAISVFGNSIFATVPENAITGPITVTTPAGSATSAAAFQVISLLAPQITGFLPETGNPGTTVFITGSNLVNVAEVGIGGATATFVSVSGTELRATVPEGATTGQIVVKTSAGIAISTGLFYSPAILSSFEPAHGTVGTLVKIHGLNLAETIAVLFGGANAPFTVVSSMEVHATVPEGATSGVISLATPAGFANSGANFLLPPIITSINPVSAPAGSGVSISGLNLLGVTSVRFGLEEAEFEPVAATALVATVPSGAISAPITVTTPAGSVTSDTFFVGLFGNLGVNLEAFPVSLAEGDLVRFTVTVTNIGPLEATGVVLTEQLPPGVQMIFAPSGADCAVSNNLITCQLGAVPAGGSRIIRVTGTVLAGPYLTNKVEVLSAGVSDPDLTDNQAILVIPLAGAPPLNVSLAAALTGNSLELSWPVSDGYVLETTPAISTASRWSAVTATPLVANGRNFVILPRSTARSFYRLRHP